MANPLERRLAAILASDMVGFSAQMEADEAGTLDRLRRCRRDLIHPGAERHRGRIVKTTGDGALMEFASAVDAVDFAVAFQRAMALRNAEGGEPAMLFRIGINVGDVVIEDGDVYGDGVNVAARLEPLAEPGGVLASAAVVDQVRGGTTTRFEDVGELRLKNIARPVRAHRIVTGVEAPDAGIARQAVRVVEDRPSIAVLPFQNMSSGPDDEFFADGLTEDILTGLSKFKELFVISRTSAFAYKGRPANMQDVAADLGVRYVLEGSVRRAGARVRVTAQLIDAVGGDRHIWADRYDRQIEDIFELQDEITSAIVATLPGRIEAASHERVARKKPESMAAHELVMIGRLLHHRSNPEDNARALEYLERAVALAPDYAHARAWRACTMGQAWGYGWIENRDEIWDRVTADVSRAQALDDKDSDVHRLLAAIAIATDDIDAARRHQDRALQLNPNDDLIVVQQGELLTWTGAPEEGIAWIRRAMALNPYHPERYWGHLGRAQFVARRYDEAIASFRKLSTADHVVHACFAAAMAGAGNEGGAKRHGAEILRLCPDFTIDGYLATLHYAREEDRVHHRAMLRRAGLPAEPAEWARAAVR
ncbi:MAG: adenylate/guanylate cyclase domain-containing protein [Azospirillaceae bacterium]